MTHEIPGVLMVGSATSCRPTSGLTGEEGDPWAGMRAQGWQEGGLACRWSLGSPSGHGGDASVPPGRLGCLV